MPEPRYSPNLAELVETLVLRGDLDRGEPAYDVALVAIDRGYDGLTRAQKRLFDRSIIPALAKIGASETATPRPSTAALPDTHDGNPWRPLREAPSDRDVQLGLIDRNGISALTFACRRVERSWLHSDTGKRLHFRPTHWREWASP